MTNTFTKKSLLRTVICALLMVVLAVGSLVSCAGDDALDKANTNEKLISDLQAAVDALEAAVAGNDGDITAIQNDVKSKIDAVNGEIATITAELNKKQEAIDAIKETLGSNSADITRLEGEIDDLESALEAYKLVVNQAIADVNAAIEKAKEDFKGGLDAVLAAIAALDEAKAGYDLIVSQYPVAEFTKIEVAHYEGVIAALRAVDAADAAAIQADYLARMAAARTYVKVLQDRIADILDPINDNIALLSIEIATDPSSEDGCNLSKLAAMEAAYNDCISNSITVSATDKAEYDSIYERYHGSYAKKADGTDAVPGLEDAKEDADELVLRMLQYYNDLMITSQEVIDDLSRYLANSYVRHNVVTDATDANFVQANYDIYSESEVVLQGVKDKFERDMASAATIYNDMMAIVEQIGSPVTFKDIDNVNAAVAKLDELKGLIPNKNVILPGETTSVEAGWTKVEQLATELDNYAKAAADDAAIVLEAYANRADKNDIRNLASIQEIGAKKDNWVATYITPAGITLSDLADKLPTYTFLTDADVTAIDTYVQDAEAHDAAATEAANAIVADINAIVDAWNNRATNGKSELSFDFAAIAVDVENYLDTYYGTTATISDSIKGVKDVYNDFTTAQAAHTAAIATAKDAFEKVDDADGMESVVELINAIGDVTCADATAISAAYAAYDAWIAQYAADIASSDLPSWVTGPKTTLDGKKAEHDALMAQYTEDLKALEDATADLNATITYADKAAVAAAEELRVALVGNAKYDHDSDTPAANHEKLAAAVAKIATIQGLWDAIHSGIASMEGPTAEGSQPTYDIDTYATIIDAVDANIALYVTENGSKDGLDQACLDKLAALKEELRLSEIKKYALAKAAELEAYVAGKIATLDATNDAEKIDALNAELANCLVRYTQSRVDSFTAVNGIHQVNLEAIDTIYNA